MKLIDRWRQWRHCPHLRQRGIYGDGINYANGNRALCLDCGRWLPNLPPTERTA